MTFTRGGYLSLFLNLSWKEASSCSIRVRRLKERRLVIFFSFLAGRYEPR